MFHIFFIIRFILTYFQHSSRFSSNETPKTILKIIEIQVFRANVFQMPPKTQKEPTNVLDIGSSDEENGAGASKRSRNASSDKAPPQTKSQTVPQQQQSSKATGPSGFDDQTLQFRSFWKAGSIAIGPTILSATAQGSFSILASYISLIVL